MKTKYNRPAKLECKLMFTFMMTIIIAMICIAFLSCEKETENIRSAELECGDPITWIYQNELQYTQIIIDFEPMEGNEGDPNTSFWWQKQGTYIESSFDGGGIYYHCYIGTHYTAHVLIDPVTPGTQGEWVFYEEGLVRKVNVLDGISWN